MVETPFFESDKIVATVVSQLYDGIKTKEIKKIVKCINPNCITNIEDIETYFKVVDNEPLKLQCHYCEKTMTNIRFEE